MYKITNIETHPPNNVLFAPSEPALQTPKAILTAE